MHRKCCTPRVQRSYTRLIIGSLGPMDTNIQRSSWGGHLGFVHEVRNTHAAHRRRESLDLSYLRLPASLATRESYRAVPRRTLGPQRRTRPNACSRLHRRADAISHRGDRRKDVRSRRSGLGGQRLHDRFGGWGLQTRFFAVTHSLQCHVA